MQLCYLIHLVKLPNTLAFPFRYHLWGEENTEFGSAIKTRSMQHAPKLIRSGLQTFWSVMWISGIRSHAISSRFQSRRSDYQNAVCVFIYWKPTWRRTDGTLHFQGQLTCGCFGRVRCNSTINMDEHKCRGSPAEDITSASVKVVSMIWTNLNASITINPSYKTHQPWKAPGIVGVICLSEIHVKMSHTGRIFKAPLILFYLLQLVQFSQCGFCAVSIKMITGPKDFRNLTHTRPSFLWNFYNEFGFVS